MKITRTILSVAAMALSAVTMTVSAETTLTSKITNPSFESGLGNWTNTNFSMQSNSSFTVKSGSIYAEKWVASGSSVGNASISQTLKGLPAGKYTLTVAAQNYSQASTTKKCTGAYIYAGEAQTPVYTPADYSVEFTTVSGQVEIGFKAVSANGNWLCVDNFRLVLNDSLDNQAIVDEMAKYLPVADSLSALTFDESAKANLLNAITTAKALNADATMKTLQAALNDLTTCISKAEFAVLLANATPGTGTAVSVKSTNHYVPTGATQALMRFTYGGSNILEKGICWSTEHNPTVLDDRSTEILGTLNGYIYIARGLQSSTVYYLRPYVMNKTYTVAYGDEVKIVTHPMGNCTGSWDEGAPDAAANARCRIAIKQTIDYFNEWTGIMGFTLSGHYGSATATADCSYGGWMRIGPNSGNQAIGTVIHETGHGVGVGTSPRWSDTNVHDWKWFGSEANKMYSFLENKVADPYTSDFCMVGDTQHGWGSSATYDWFVNGADKDKHCELQYVGGCCLLYALFVDGLCPTSSYANGLPGYTFNFDDTKKYYIMCKDKERGAGTGLITATSAYAVRWKDVIDDTTQSLSDNDAWYVSYDAQTGLYSFKNAGYGKFLKHPTTSNAILGFATTSVKTPTATEKFQLMPARTDTTLTASLGNITTKGYWLTTTDLKGMEAQAATDGVGKVSVANFDYADTGTKQQWIILSEDELKTYYGIGFDKGDVNRDGAVNISDVNAVISVMCGDATYEKYADVNGDGVVNISDVNAVISIICGE